MSFDHDFSYQFDTLFTVNHSNGFCSLECDKPLHTEYSEVYMLSMANDKNVLKEFINAEINGDTIKAGNFLGYPECCIKAFEHIGSLKSKWAIYYQDDYLKNKKASLYCNRFPIFFNSISPIGELFPCSLSCDNSKNYAKSMLSDMKALGFFKLVDKILEISNKDIYINKYGNFSLKKHINFNQIKFS